MTPRPRPTGFRRTGIALATLALTGCLQNLGGYGNYGGASRNTPTEAVSMEQTVAGTRWFPRHVRFAPDGSNLLVSLCHTKSEYLCRIGRYHLTSDRWEILPYESDHTYSWPLYSPDGKFIYVMRTSCDERLRCDFAQEKLLRLSADGRQTEEIAPIIATHLSISADGKRLLYWRVGSIYSIGGRAQTRANIVEMDLETRTERPMLKDEDLYLFQDYRTFPYYLSDGESFLFNALFRKADRNLDEAKSGWSIAKLKDVPVGARDVIGAGNNPAINGLDMTADDRFVQNGSVSLETEEGVPIPWLTGESDPDRGVPPGRPQVQDARSAPRPTGRRNALLLKPGKPAARYVAAFDFNGCGAAAVTPSGHLAACIHSPDIFSPFHTRLEVSRFGERGSRRIDWPRLDLPAGFIELKNPH